MGLSLRRLKGVEPGSETRSCDTVVMSSSIPDPQSRIRKLYASLSVTQAVRFLRDDNVDLFWPRVRPLASAFTCTLRVKRGVPNSQVVRKISIREQAAWMGAPQNDWVQLS